MTVRVNKQAVFAKLQSSKNTAAVPTGANVIPISSDISKTFIEDNSVERPELKATFGANDSVIISETQGISIPSFIQGGGASSAIVAAPPVDPLLQACFHGLTMYSDSSNTTNNASEAKCLRYAPVDDDPSGGGATVLYQIDGIRQQMVDAIGTMTLNVSVGGFASMGFEMQGPYAAPTKTDDLNPSGSSAEVLAVTGATTLKVPGLPEQFADCVRSISLTQNATIASVDCASKLGNRAITYTQTGRASTGEIVVDMDADTVASLAGVWGGKGSLKSPHTPLNDASGLLVLGTTAGNKFAIGINNYKIGAPVAGETDGIGTWTFPFTCIPKDGKPDYELFYY